MRKRQSYRWFRAVRGSFIPKSWQGWILYIPLIILAGGVWVLAYNSNCAIGERLIAVVAEFISLTVIFHAIARRLT